MLQIEQRGVGLDHAGYSATCVVTRSPWMRTSRVDSSSAVR
jgi:hypothetical protein